MLEQEIADPQGQTLNLGKFLLHDVKEYKWCKWVSVQKLIITPTPYLLRSQDAAQRALEKALSLETNSVPWPPVSGMGYDWVRTLPMWGLQGNHPQGDRGKKSVRISTWPCVVLGNLKHGWKWEYDSCELSEFKIMGIVCISGSCLSCFIAINFSWNP